MKTVIVEVTERDILDGQHNDCFACPVALAMKRAGLVFPNVGTTGVHLGPDRSRLYNVPLPESVPAFIRKFDVGLPVEPFTFELRYDS